MADRDRRVTRWPRQRVGESIEPREPGPDVAGNWTWTVYDGRPESVSDGVEVAPPAVPRPRRWPWAVAAAGAAAVIAVVAVRAAPTPAEPDAERPPAAAAPAQWGQVDASLTRGLVTVHGGGEADGVVLTGEVIVTSHSRLQGDQRPPDDGYALQAAVDGQSAVGAKIIGVDEATDIAVLRAPGLDPHGVARAGGTVRVGETLTLLDDQGGRQPVLGVAVTVTASDQTCSRAGSTARPKGFRFSLQVASAEPGAALVRADGTVVGVYFGGDDATHHCAIPIADVLAVLAASESNE
jgi:S1-C subfamily serine protease